MKFRTGVLVVLLSGAAFGAATSLINDVSSPYGLIGRHLTGTVWAWLAGFTSKLIGTGWAWAAIGIAAGWLASTRLRAVVGGALMLLAATTAYYSLDAVLWGGSSGGRWGGIVLWWVASVICGPVLGLVGALAGSPGVVGLLARLTLPIGAGVERIIIVSHSAVPTPTINWPAITVWSGATIATGVMLVRFGTARVRHREAVPDFQGE